MLVRFKIPLAIWSNKNWNSNKIEHLHYDQLQFYSTVDKLEVLIIDNDYFTHLVLSNLTFSSWLDDFVFACEKLSKFPDY